MDKRFSKAASVLALACMAVVFALQVSVTMDRRAGRSMSIHPGGGIAYGYGSCGNSSLDGSEECDMGPNNGMLMGCSSSCTISSGYACDTSSPTNCSSGCGDGVKANYEQCDDGDNDSGDGCSSICRRESGYVCNEAGTTCTNTCGNGRKHSSEACDDGNTTANDGCSATCTIETDYTCSSCTNDQQSTMTPGGCGSGTRSAAEGCDDGNTTANDGCSATCTIETGYSCTNASPNVCTASCGDGTKAGSEACDDGNTSNADNCTNTCTVAACGDGYKNGNESCDPSDATDPNKSGCSVTCGLAGGGGGAGVGARATEPLPEPKKPAGPRPACGNGIVEQDKGEQCDPGPHATNPECSPQCQVLRCGDGVVTVSRGEECEPRKDKSGAYYHPLIGTDGKKRTCGFQYCALPMRAKDGTWKNGCRWVKLPACAAGVTEQPDVPARPFSPAPVTPRGAAEQVIRDAIESVLPDAPTIPSSYLPVCGDSRLEGFGMEECDDGNDVDGDGCSSSCTIERGDALCGNAVRENGEECDDGPRNSNTAKDACRTDCRAPSCGDRVRDSGEECDDGNDIAGDGCAVTCQRNICGNGTLEPGEECDDGVRNTDVIPNACRRSCILPRCGDGLLDSAFGEQCDDGVLNSNEEPDACRLHCMVASCGDGVRDEMEKCDDGNTFSGDGCSARCTPEAPAPRSFSFLQWTILHVVTPTVSGLEWIARMLGLN